MRIQQKVTAFALAAGVSIIAISGTAAAHVVVRPAEVETASYTTFTVGVPNEKDVATTSVKVVMPTAVSSVMPTQKPGWRIETQKNGSGEDATVTAITWNGAIAPGFRDDLTFTAKTPKNNTDLQWKAYQTYADGSVVSWDKSGSGETEGTDSGPFSVSKVVARTEQAAAVATAEQTARNAQASAKRAMSFGVVGVALAIVGLFFATRRKKEL
jgi:uncharacterized protein YcnI